jgi:hypothetical protein
MRKGVIHSAARISTRIPVTLNSEFRATLRVPPGEI